MQYRELGGTGFRVSEISFGAWGVGGSWGKVDDADSMKALHKALDLGVNFFDTADVYGDGRSEKLLARLKSERSEPFYIATKAGRRSSPHTAESYTRENLTAYVERSLANLKADALDLLQLHCPPNQVFYMPEAFDFLEDLKTSGKIRHYGVSVEKTEQALKSIEYPGVQSVQIVYNIFRQRPAELFFKEAQKKRVGIIARLPLSSGMLTGKMTENTQFEPEDHRTFNRDGEAFDKGETFSGLDFQIGLRAVEALRPLVPPGATLAQMALKWVVLNPAVTCAIPGAKRSSQVEENVRATELPELSEATLSAISEIYRVQVKPAVHHRW